MNLEDAKKQILRMAEDINQGNFSEQMLASFILSFRYDFFNTPTIVGPPGWQPGMPGISCSCGPMKDSCNECGEGKYTEFMFDHNANFLGSIKCDKEIK